MLVLVLGLVLLIGPCEAALRCKDLEVNRRRGRGSGDCSSLSEYLQLLDGNDYGRLSYISITGRERQIENGIALLETRDNGGAFSRYKIHDEQAVLHRRALLKEERLARGKARHQENECARL